MNFDNIDDLELNYVLRPKAEREAKEAQQRLKEIDDESDRRARERMTPKTDWVLGK